MRATAMPCIETARLVTTLVVPGMENALLDFHIANAEHFLPWDPPRSAGAFEHDHWRVLAERSLGEFESGAAVRFAMFLRGDATRVVGTANYSQITRGPFQAAFLGYKLAADCEGRGLMSEALQATLDYMFNEQHLHRIHANYIPQNIRSGRLLARLGFTIEGYATDYLFINGAWRDHILTSRTNDAFQVGWLAT